MPTCAGRKLLVQNGNHEMLMTTARLDIITRETQRLRRLKSETRIIADMPYQEEQAVAPGLNLSQSGADKR